MIFGLIIISFLISFWFYKKTTPQLRVWHKRLLLLLRTIALGIVLILLFNPIITFIQDKITQPQIIILTDTSASMEQQGEQGTKSEIFRELKKELKNKYRSTNFDLIEYDFANGLQGPNNNTLLSETLIELSKKADLKNLEQIYLLSDGWLQDENLIFLDNLDYPITTFSPQFSFADFDLEIGNVRFSSTTYKDEIVPIFVQLQATNYAGKAEVVLKINSENVQTKNIEFSEKEFIDLQFEHVFLEAGLHDLQVIVKADSTEETNLENNRYPTSIQIRNNKLKCLIVADKLSWDVSFIIQSMSTDEYWQTKFLLKTDRYYHQNNVTNFSQELEDVNTLLIINQSRLQLPSQDADLIENFVSKGGGLIQFGNIVPNLQSLLPASRTNLNRIFESTIRLTEDSKEFQTFRWQDSSVQDNIPPMRYYYVNAKLQAKVFATIANEQQSPAILFQPYENGKVMYFALLDLWKWQMWTKGDHYKTFMHNLINWFGQQAADRIVARTSQTSYFAGEQIEIGLKVYTEQFNLAQNVDAVLTLYDSEDEIILEDYFTNIANQYRLKLPDLPAGKYRYQIKDQISQLSTDGEFTVIDFNPEMRDKGINSILLAYISKTTNGEFLNSSEAINISEKDNIIEKIQIEIPLYTKWYLIALFLVSFCLELYFRKRWGLL